jgi:NAD+ kinase
LRGQAPKALRWKRLEQRYRAHHQCVTDLLSLLRKHDVVQFSCVNRVDLDRQHLQNVDLMVAVGGDGTVLSSAHFIDHGTIPLLGINSDPNKSGEDLQVKKKKSDERRSHGALCMFTATNMEQGLQEVLYGGGNLQKRTRIRCKVRTSTMHSSSSSPPRLCLHQQLDFHTTRSNQPSRKHSSFRP